MSADCLNEIFEYLEEDKVTLRSCLLVNRLCCAISVRILWRSVRNFSTLIVCLPNESKEILYNNGVIASTLDSKSPMFNYATFCKVLSIKEVNNEIIKLLKNHSLQALHIVMGEILKFIMDKDTLRKLKFFT